jgi:hypothetical protein
MKYIFLAGAPGSKWSSVARNIYYSPDIDRSDYTEDRVYSHSASGSLQPMHIGAYWDPGMEFDIPRNLSSLTKEELEQKFDSPFTGQGVRIIKSHIFCHNIDFLKATWPDCPVVLIYRSDDSCLGWWVKCGEFSIRYPSYDSYYVDLPTMAAAIGGQNADLLQARHRYQGPEPENNFELADLLKIARPGIEYTQYYAATDVKVMVI